MTIVSGFNGNASRTVGAEALLELVSTLTPKVESLVPGSGRFKAVYTECKVNNPNLCLTDILLKVEPLPEHLHANDNQRYLTIVGYKLPPPIKCSQILYKGTKDEILRILRYESLIPRIEIIIQRLNDNLYDV